jgi:hypothetical protein
MFIYYKMMMKRKLFVAFLIGALAKVVDAELITDFNASHNGRTFSTAAKAIYHKKVFTTAIEMQVTGSDVKTGFALKTKGRNSLQLDGDSKGNAEAKVVMGTDKCFSTIAGAGRKEKDEKFDYGKYAAATYTHSAFPSLNNFGAGIFVADGGSRKIGGYAFGRIKGIFGGYNWSPDGERFVLSRPSEKGWAARWFGLRHRGFSYDQLNFATDSEVLGGIDSFKALQDPLTNNEDSPVAPNIFPLRFRSRPDERGKGVNMQFSRIKRGKKVSYAGELDIPAKNSWVGSNYNTDGRRYGVCLGRTEHFRYGSGRVPYSLRMDLGYSGSTRDISAGISFARRFK